MPLNVPLRETVEKALADKHRVVLVTKNGTEYNVTRVTGNYIIQPGESVPAFRYDVMRGSKDIYNYWTDAGVFQYGTDRDENFDIVQILVGGEGIVKNEDRFAKKFDQGKMIYRPLMRGLVLAVEAVSAILNYGAQKYEEDSWQSVPDGRKRYEDAFYRHQIERNKGQTYDDESGLPHLAHMICNLMFLLWFEIQEGIITNWTKFNKPRDNASQ